MHAYMLAHPCSFEGHIFPLIALIYTDIHRFCVHSCPIRAIRGCSILCVALEDVDSSANCLYCR